MLVSDIGSNRESPRTHELARGVGRLVPKYSRKKDKSEFLGHESDDLSMIWIESELPIQGTGRISYVDAEESSLDKDP